MPASPPRVLLANHHLRSLADLEAALRRSGFEITSTTDLVATTARLSEGFDLVIFQPLVADLSAFEVESVLGPADAERAHALLLLLPELEPGPARGALPAATVDDFVRGDVPVADLLERALLVVSRRRLLLESTRQARALARDSITDFKTALYNDRFFFQRLREEVARSRRHRLALALVLFDFDDFKAINDQFDHLFGDFVLLAFARKLRAIVRQIDIPARLGGDEFALLLPNTDLEEAALLASRLRTAVAEYRFEKDGRATRLAVSMGVDSMQGDEPLEPEEFLRRADAALLEAKRRGKNRICLYPEIAPARDAPSATRAPK